MSFTNKTSAKIADNRLVLSMPGAETPVVWVMDLSEASTSVLRLELDKQGLYVIKKHGGKSVETVAVFKNRNKALRALSTITKTLDKASKKKAAQSGSRLQRNLIIILFIWFALFRLGQLDTLFLAHGIAYLIDGDASNLTTTSSYQPTMAEQEAALRQLLESLPQEGAAPHTQTPQPAQTPPARTIGVPLSADDFLREQAVKK